MTDLDATRRREAAVEDACIVRDEEIARLQAERDWLKDRLEETTNMLEALTRQCEAWEIVPVVPTDRCIHDNRAALATAKPKEPANG